MLGRLRLWQKMGLLILLMALPIPVILYFYVDAKDERIVFNQKEVWGTQYFRPLHKLLGSLPRHRDLAERILGVDDPARKEELVRLQAQIDEEFKAVAAVDRQIGGALVSSEKFSGLQQSWQALRDQVLGLQPRDSTQKHAELVNAVWEHIKFVGDKSNLILDPDLDSYYLMDGVILNIPSLLIQLDTLQDQGRELADKIELAVVLGIAQYNIENLQRNYPVAYKEAANFSRIDVEGRVKSFVDGAVGPSQAFLDLFRTRVLKGDALATADPENIAARAAQASQQVLQLYGASNDLLQELCQKRVDQYTREKYIGVPIIIGAVLVTILLGVFITRNILRQIREITFVFDNVGRGRFEARAKILGRDELGQMGVSLNSMLDSTLSLIQSREERDQIQRSILKLLDEVSGVASGDLTVEAEVTADMTGAIADAFNLMLGELRDIIGNVKETVLHLSTAASQIQATANSLSRGSEAQAEQILETSAAIEEMAVSVQQVSENANTSATVAQQSLKNARQGGEAVGKTIDGMQSIREQVSETAKRIKRLGESSQEIGEIIQLIGDIADRTSILALNASIQAAMAGDAGRGFAVVAEEVERLAVRSTEATKRVGMLVKTIQTETGEAVAAMESTTSEVVRGSKLANEAGQTLVEIESVSNRLADLIQSISHASRQQARGSEALAKAMSEISGITQQAASGTREAAVSISNLSQLADELRDSVSRFKLPAGSR